MTREEREQAIAILENEKKCVNRANKNDYCNRDCYNCELVKTDTEILTALDMAIKAIKQESVLNKIRAEIKNASLGRWYFGRLDGKSEEVLPLDKALQIIDKYEERSDKE